LDALEAVLRSFDGEHVDRLVCLGDTVGYGAEPNECCDRVREVSRWVTLGNHDAAVTGRMDYSYYYDAARQALDFHASQLSEDNLDWLQKLPYEEADGEATFCHGSPLDLEEFDYIFTPQQAGTCLPIWDELNRVTFIGHSHLCRAFALAKSRVYEVITKDFELRPEFRYIVSVGSVGQPRDQDPRASYAVYDAEQARFEFKRVEYDVASAARKIFDDEHLVDSFGARLFAGI
jgi:diadenosine tetraphosphatase ApaH/serine/threonine PP2A family protein phosphatase